jgi:hypothetical protein
LIPSSPSPEQHAAASGVDDDGDRPSVTDVNGTVARFEMSYSPPAGERLKFGPPLAARIPSAIYLAAAVVLGGLVAYAYGAASSNSLLFVWVVEKDRGRPLGADVLTAIVVISAVATVLRTHMCGVIVSDDWVEARYLLAFGIPRARRWAWVQVHRVVLDRSRVAFELWDGSFERLPEVAKGRELVDLILQHAQGKRIDVTILDPATRR